MLCANHCPASPTRPYCAPGLALGGLALGSGDCGWLWLAWGVLCCTALHGGLPESHTLPRSWKAMRALCRCARHCASCSAAAGTPSWPPPCSGIQQYAPNSNRTGCLKALPQPQRQRFLTPGGWELCVGGKKRPPSSFWAQGSFLSTCRRDLAAQGAVSLCVVHVHSCFPRRSGSLQSAYGKNPSAGRQV